MRLPIEFAAAIFFAAFFISLLTAREVGVLRALKQYLTTVLLLVVLGFPAVFVLSAGLVVFALDIVGWVYFLLFCGVIGGATLGGWNHSESSSSTATEQSKLKAEGVGVSEVEQRAALAAAEKASEGLKIPASNGKKGNWIDFLPGLVVLAVLILPAYLYIGKDYWQSDVEVTYGFQLQTPGFEFVSFSGSASCAHRRNNMGSFAYQILNPTLEIQRDDTWLVTGVSCYYFMDNQHYDLTFYKHIDDRLANVYFPNRFNQIVNFTTVSKDVSIPDDVERVFDKTFEYGPYVYRIETLQTVPEFASTLTSSDPILLSYGPACSSHIDEALVVESSSFNKNTDQIKSYSTGVLSYDLEQDAWVTGNTIDPAVAPMVGDESTILSIGCIELAIRGKRFVLGDRGATAVYFPEENTVLHLEVMRSGLNSRNPYSNTIRWRPCEIDSELIQHMSSDEIYVYIEPLRGFSRVTPQGAECAETIWPYL